MSSDLEILAQVLGEVRQVELRSACEAQGQDYQQVCQIIERVLSGPLPVLDWPQERGTTQAQLHAMQIESEGVAEGVFRG